MTNRERLLATIHHQPTDRVPISLYELTAIEGCGYSNFAHKEPSYRRLMQAAAEKTDTLLMSGPTYTAPAYEQCIETHTRREGKSVYRTTVLHTPKGDLTSRYRTDDDVITTWTLEHPLKTLEDIEKYMSLDFTATMDTTNMMRDLQALGEDGLLLTSVADPICHGAELFAMEDFLVYALTDTDVIQRFLDWLWEIVRERLAMLMKEAPKDIVFRIVGPEYGTPPYLPNRYVHGFVTQYVTRMATMIRQGGGIPRVHSHGKVRFLLSELAGSDVLCIDPVEPPPDGDISLREVKALYGDRLALFGNIELKALETETPQAIDALIRSVMEDGKPGGGFVLMPTASPINIPLNPRTEENLLMMMDAGLRYGQY